MDEKIRVLISGLPGNMATTFTRHALKEEKIDIINISITGVDCDLQSYNIDGCEFKLIKSSDKEGIDALFSKYKNIILVDYTEPAVVNQNIDLYCRKGVNFIIGTTGVVMDRIADKLNGSDINAIIAPNMGKQIVALQSMMKYASENFADCFKDYILEIKESHQNGKVDTSGTARTMVGYFNKLGVNYDERDIIKCRDPKEQLDLGVPKEYLTGHGWHNYKLTSADKTVHIELTHNVNGRDIYAKGTIDSIFFLNEKIKKGICGKLFSMIDVLENKQ
jgi:4-hydroxy-tetrahydrodipicolinate reductase